MTAGAAIDPNALVQEVLRESYLQTTKDLRAYAEKVKMRVELLAAEKGAAVRRYDASIGKANAALASLTVEKGDLRLPRDVNRRHEQLKMQVEQLAAQRDATIQQYDASIARSRQHLARLEAELSSDDGLARRMPPAGLTAAPPGREIRLTACRTLQCCEGAWGAQRQLYVTCYDDLNALKSENAALKAEIYKLKQKPICTDGHIWHLPNGSTINCYPYGCQRMLDQHVACMTSCTSVDDCASLQMACSPAGKCYAP